MKNAMLTTCAAALMTAAVLACPPRATAAWVHPELADVLSDTPPGERVHVYAVLRDQVDLPAILREMKEVRAPLSVRHYEVLTRARRLARETQAPLLEWLEQHRASGMFSYHAFWISNAVAIEATPAFVRKLAQRPELASIFLDYPIEIIAPAGEPEATTAAGNGIENGIMVTGAPEMWALGFDGTGTLACHQDTGVDGKHPAFADRWRGLQPGVDPSEAWFDPHYGETFPTDSDIHGTHTMGTMVGDDGAGNQVGMAPGAQWIGAKTIDVPYGDIFSDAVAGFQWAADPDGDPATMDDVPDVINNSWGLQTDMYGSCLPDFNAAIDTVEAAGTVVIFAAGNEGGAGLRSPANRIATDLNVFAVGALNQDNETAAGFSSRGPSDCDGQTIKPEVAAVGVNVRSSFPGGGYGTLDGTSMAAPHVSGAVLLLRQAYPEATPEEIKYALYITATDLGVEGEDNTYGMGAINVYEAYLWLKSYMVNSDGRIKIAQVYTCTDEMTITLADIDLVGPTAEVSIASTTEPAGETVTLAATEDEGIYTGTIQLASAEAVSGDGVLSVSDSDEITVSYLDADDGDGNQNVLKTATAVTDCAPPVFAGVEAAEAGDYQVALTWSEAVDAHAVSYNVYRATASMGYDFSQPLANVTDTSYLDESVENGETYYYLVRALDQLGHEDTNEVEIAATPFGPDRIFRDRFDGDSLEPWTRNNGGKCRATWLRVECWDSSWCDGGIAFVDHGDCFPWSPMDEQLISPALDCSGYTGVELRFSHYFDQEGSEIGDVDYSLDGRQWTTAARFRGKSAIGREVVDLSALDGASTCYIRFHFYKTNMMSDDWGIDDVELVGWPVE